MMSLESIGTKLRLAREQARMSQTEAAQAVQVTSAALSQYEGGKRKIDPLMMDRLARLYGVPVGYFFGEDSEQADWEASLRHIAEVLSPEGKEGVGELIRRIHALEELFTHTGTAYPGLPHPPFPPLDERDFTNREVAEYAEKARRHFDLGLAPIQDLRSLLEALGYLVFTVPLGKSNGDVSGLYFRHPELGPVVVINEDQAFTRRPFTMAHEMAHGLYHYDRPAILCRVHDARPLEVFAERFASHFLVPRDALRDRLRDSGMQRVERPEEVVRLARYFGVSYGAMQRILSDEQRLGVVATAGIRPVKLAEALGYAVSKYEFGLKPLPVELRLPRVFLELAYRAVREEKLSLRRVAEMLGISDVELEERLYPEGEETEELEEVYA
jgi:Zn-dependent peptidase ImmA (M78 family)/transcriptional regulator with XRE-family HTH domain